MENFQNYPPVDPVIIITASKRKKRLASWLKSSISAIALMIISTNIHAKTDVATIDFTSKTAYLPAVKVEPFGTFNIRLDLSNEAPIEFVIKELIPAPTVTDPLATFNFHTGILHIPFVKVILDNNTAGEDYYGDMKLVQGSSGKFVVTKGVLAKQMAVFELLATKPHSLTDISSKSTELQATLTAIANAIDSEPDMSVAISNQDIGKLGTKSKLLPFPAIDSDMNGSADEVGYMLEVSFSQDSQFLNLGLQYGIALPWQIAAYTDGNSIKVITAVPQALLRTYFKDDNNIKQLLSLTSQYQSKIEKLVASALQTLGFTTNINTVIKNTLLGETEIAAIEMAHGKKLTPDFASPSITISDSSVDVKTVINGITNRFLADEAGDHAVLPNAINNYLAGSISFEELFQVIEQGKDIWAKGGTFQNWDLLRTIEFSDEQGGSYQRIEISQQFYANMGMNFGLYHMPALPCNVGVWKDSKGIHINLSNPRFLFAYLFSDIKLDPNNENQQRIRKILKFFPSILFNELANMINGVINDLGGTEKFELLPLRTYSARAFYGDPKLQRMVAIDIPEMKLVSTQSTPGKVPYPVDRAGNEDKVYAITRGSDWIDVYDVRLTKYFYTIPLKHGPRSADAYNTALGLVLVTGSNKAMASLIDPKTDTVVAVTGNNIKTNPKDYGGSLSSGHPFWLTERQFVIIDRANRKIQMYQLNGSMANWQIEFINEITTPTSVHHIIYRDHTNPANSYKNTYYAIAEGAHSNEAQPPLLLELQLKNEKLILNRQVSLNAMGVTGTGSHHGDFHPDGKHIYIGTDEGHCFVIDQDNMTVVKVIETGKGHGHTQFVPKRNIAITTNHKDTYISIIDSNTHTKITDITVSGEQQNNEKLQSHTYYLSPDNRYYYAFASDNGIFYELDLEELKITNTLKTGGTPIQGVFIDRSKWMGN
jgi:hypothetical protein